ncbi:hypothetical protein NC653_040344 [Populus alba x Populus x berolinensis]|uniref:Wall-associated receptor kinase galacturonan-binding domain-containing protein n=1 Tax=Populus alba x Populus x berolinensis TaxID=444605 RepID=A0AAD6PRN2_9ROSI|nr:hypothetical protein NC653_040344 [Populus alba x Populus x berolinensis]
MEAGCYLDKRFRIHCNSNMTPRLSINGINLEELNISVDEGTIHVKFPIFYSINNIVLMTQNDSIYGGCMSICDESSNSARNHASCNGINCCQMRIPSHLMSFNAVFKDLDGSMIGSIVVLRPLTR